MDKDEELEIDLSFDRPIPLRRKVALPHGSGVPLQEAGPCDKKYDFS